MRIPEPQPDWGTLEAALAYAAAGMYVLPVKRGQKNPGSIVGNDWSAQSSTDPQQIVAWFAGTDRGIAIDCGRSGLVVIDVDHPEFVPESLSRELDAAPCQATRDVSVAPGRNHYIFRQPEGRRIGCSTGELGGGWGDVKGWGGAIMADPSEHPEPDGQYRWLRTGYVPVLPARLADSVPDAGASETAATPAEVSKFLAEHTAAAVPTVMSAWQKIWRDKIAAGESRHTTAVSVTTGALKEAAAGLFSATAFLEWLEPEFVAAKTRQPIGRETQLTAEQALRKLWEPGGIVAWAVSQARAADPLETLERTNRKTPSPALDQHRQSMADNRNESSTVTETLDTEIHRGQVRMAYRLAAAYEGQLLHVRSIGWHHWDGKRWAVDESGHATRAVLDILRTAITESVGDTSDQGKKLRSDVAKCESAAGIDGVLSVASALNEFACTVSDLDSDPWLLNCANGTLDLRTMLLSAHSPADRITKVTRAAHKPFEANGVAWQAFLERVLPDSEVREYLQRIIGMALQGKVSEHILPILTGTGANGKGTFYSAVLWALGDYGCPAEPDLFMQAKNQHTTGQMDLMGRRLVVVSESGEGHRLDEAKMKRLTGGDEIKARKMHRDFVSFAPSHTALFITNHLPRVSGDDPATWRRIRVIPFTVSIPKEEQDGELDVTLKLEADAVLAWAIGGWLAYQQRKLLDQPEAVVTATGTYRLDSDVIAQFLDARCHMSPAVRVTARELFAAWDSWRVRDGQAPEMSKRAFGMNLANRGYASKKSNGETWWEGISVQKDWAT